MRTISTLLTLSFQVILVITGTERVRAQAPAPAATLLTEENSARAIALDAVTQVCDPLPVVALNNLGQDRRTRSALFGIDVDLSSGEDALAVTPIARDAWY